MTALLLLPRDLFTSRGMSMEACRDALVDAFPVKQGKLNKVPKVLANG